MLRSSLTVLAVLTIAACGGDGGAGPAAPPPPPAPSLEGNITGERTAVNAARLADLTALRSQCGGNALPTVTSDRHLITSAIRHAGWQALYDQLHGGTSLNPYEIERNALYTFYDPSTPYDWYWRIILCGAPDGPPLAEDTTGLSNSQTMAHAWNSVYNRIPMMMHGFKTFGYGDMRLARLEYPSALVPAISPWDQSDDGYATLDWAGDLAQSITLSFWPKAGVANVPTTYLNQEDTPTPFPAMSSLGPPLHAIFPTTLYLTALAPRLRPASGGADIPIGILVGIGLGNDPAKVPLPPLVDPNNRMVNDNDLDAGQVFILPLAPLAPSTSYSWSCTASDSQGALPAIGLTTFTTAP